MPNIRYFATLAALYFAAFGNFLFNQISLYVGWPLAFIFSGIQIKHVLKQSYFKYYIILWVFFLISWIFAVDFDVAFSEIKMMLGVVVSAITLFSIGRNEKTIPWLYGAFLVFYIGMIYTVQKTGILLGFDIQSERLSLDNLNANFFGYYTFYLTFSVFILGDIIYNVKLKIIFKWLFILMIPLSAIIALLTASRQVIIVQAPTITILLILRYFTKFKTKNIIVALLVILIVIGLYGSTISNIFDNSILNQRSQIDTGEDARMVHLIHATQIGLDNLLVGVGPGCYKTFTGGFFSHCSYTEIFANYGLMATIFYIWILSHFAWTQWKRFKKSKDKMYLSFCIFGLIFIVDNMFYVFYTGMWLMAFFFLVVIHSDIYYRRQYQQI